MTDISSDLNIGQFYDRKMIERKAIVAAFARVRGCAEVARIDARAKA